VISEPKRAIPSVQTPGLARACPEKPPSKLSKKTEKKNRRKSFVRVGGGVLSKGGWQGGGGWWAKGTGVPREQRWGVGGGLGFQVVGKLLVCQASNVGRALRTKRHSAKSVQGTKHRGKRGIQRGKITYSTGGDGGGGAQKSADQERPMAPKRVWKPKF